MVDRLAKQIHDSSRRHAPLMSERIQPEFGSFADFKTKRALMEQNFLQEPFLYGAG